MERYKFFDQFSDDELREALEEYSETSNTQKGMMGKIVQLFVAKERFYNIGKVMMHIANEFSVRLKAAQDEV